MRVPLTTFLLLAATVTAGCSNGSTNVAPGPEFEDLELEATATTGVVRGVVVDTAIIPIEGALVTMTGGAQTTTTADGLFGFDGVEPGTVFLQVSKPGYNPTQQSTEVIAGLAEPSVVKVLLERDPLGTPFYVQHNYKGVITCGFKTANYVWDSFYCDPTGHTGYDARDTSRVHFAVDRNPDYFQSEMFWKATQEFSKSLVTIQWVGEDLGAGEGSEDRLCNVRGFSPLVCRVTPEEGGGGGGFGLKEADVGAAGGYIVQMFANCNPCVPTTILGVGIVYEQQYEVYDHLFYGYLPPEDWLFVETSMVPSPP